MEERVLGKDSATYSYTKRGPLFAPVRRDAASTRPAINSTANFQLTDFRLNADAFLPLFGPAILEETITQP